MLLWHNRNPQILSAYPQSIAFNPQFWLLNPPFSILLPQISFIQPQFSTFNSSFPILSKKYGIVGSKSPQNSVISDKMSASGACTACSFFRVWLCNAGFRHEIITLYVHKGNISSKQRILKMKYTMRTKAWKAVKNFWHWFTCLKYDIKNKEFIT